MSIVRACINGVPSSVRSGMDDSPFQARSLSAISSGDMPLLKELGDLMVRSGYRHGAPQQPAKGA